MKKRIISAILLVFVAVVALIPAAGLNASAAETKSYTFSSYTAGTQYAKNEVHVLDEDITVVTNNCHFTSELRIYSSSSNNGYAIIKSTSKVITAISVNAGNKTDTLVVYGSNDDGANWTEAGTISVTSTSYKDYTLSLSDSYKWLKIDVKGSNQVRLKKMSLTLETVSTSCQHANTATTEVAATCTSKGSITTTCNDCGNIIKLETIENVPHIAGDEATCTTDQTCVNCDYIFEKAAHQYENGVCTVCGETQPNEVTVSTTIQKYASDNSWTSGTKYTQLGVDDNITITVTGGTNTGKYYSSNQSWRLYQNESATIKFESNNGYTISSVKITYTNSNSGTLKLNGSNVASATAVSVNANTVTFNVGNTGSGTNGNIQITEIEVVYELPSADTGCAHENTTEARVEATCTTEGSVQVTCDDCEMLISAETLPTIPHKFVNNVCTGCGILDLENIDLSGRYYIAAKRATGNFWYMTNNLGTASTKRYQIVDSGYSNVLPASIYGGDADKVFVLVKNNDGTYSIYSEGINSDEKYLGWTSGNSGIFVEESSALKFSVSLNDDHSISLHFTSSDGERYLALNSASDSNYFAFYKSGQRQNLDLIPVLHGFTGASLNVGADLSIRYHAFLSDDVNNYTVRFTMNDKVTEVKGVLENGKYVFSFCGITPQCMGDIVKAELLLNGEVVDTIEEYSVKSYVVKAFEIHADNAILLQFLSDMLYYGAEAQKYTNYKTNALVTDGIELYEASTNAPAADYKHKSIVTEDGYDKTLAKFTAAGVNFDYNNRIFVKLTGSDLENVELYVNGALIEIEEIGEGKYIAYSYAISALEFEDEFEFELYYNGELAQTLTYTVADYVVAMQGDVEIGSLVNALYNYGMSAKEYNTNK